MYLGGGGGGGGGGGHNEQKLLTQQYEEKLDEGLPAWNILQRSVQCMNAWQS